MRKTKIICTLGPAVEKEEILKKLVLSGLNVARLNFSHGSHEEHQERVDTVKKVRKELNLPIALLLDTKGPEIRTGKFAEKEVTLVEGNKFTLVNEEILGDATRVSVTYKNLYKDVEKGCRILINDGLIELEVTEIEGKDIVCKVLNGGVLSNNKGINVPGVIINLPSLTEKDVSDILFAVKNDFDFIAASFVRKAEDVIEIKKILEKNNGLGIKVIAKIENRQGLDNVDEIIKVADGIMVARGDLGVEIPVEEVPIMQKMMIRKCNEVGKPVVTATQMLDSMIRNPRPTRAEASDVANAIFDGTSAIMLSGESAAGKYPIEAVTTMSKIAEKTEAAIDFWKNFKKKEYQVNPTTTNAISHATCTTAHDLNAKAIITITQSGHTAKAISKFKPQCPIIATTPDEKVYRQLALSWGVIPRLVSVATSTDEIFKTGIEEAKNTGLVGDGDLVVVTSGGPTGVSGTTNTLKVHRVGKILAQGKGIGFGMVTGKVCVAKNAEEANNSFEEGDILVVPATSNEMLPCLKKATAIVVEDKGLGSHTAMVGLGLGIPVITGVENITNLLKSDEVVTVDAERGVICYRTKK